MDEIKLNLQECHKKQAINNFNTTWDLIDKTDRAKEDNIKMIHTAHASRFHWSDVGTPIEFAKSVLIISAKSYPSLFPLLTHRSAYLNSEFPA